MKTVLVRFKVYNFRSIEESEWIEVSDNTCLIGTNESGKTNLLIALWKLHPANGEPIIPLNDFPRHLYSNYKAGGHEKDIFIAADFILVYLHHVQRIAILPYCHLLRFFLYHFCTTIYFTSENGLLCSHRFTEIQTQFNGVSHSPIMRH